MSKEDIDERFLRPFPTTLEIGRRIRAARKRLGWTIAEMAQAGQINAVVIGSYERGSRNMPLTRLGEIARILQVDVSYLLGEPAISNPYISNQNESTLILDLRAISRPNFNDPERYATIVNFTAGIVKSRNDWNGEVLSIRQSDLVSMSFALAISTSELLNWLNRNKYLVREQDRS